MADEFIDRQPVIPLSLENVDLSRAREFIIDYTTYEAYIKMDNGNVINITESDGALEFLKQYILIHPDMILDVIIIDEENNTKSIKEAIEDIYNQIVILDNKRYLYAGSSTDGGPANRAEKVNSSITFKSSSSSTSFNGSASKTILMDNYNLYKKSGGEITGPMITKNNILLAENISYGMEFPSNPKQGQLFILLKEDI